MGIGFVLLIWAVVGLIGAEAGSEILSQIVSRFTSGRGDASRRLLLTARWFPFVCLAWAGCVFVVYAVVNDTVFHRDPGIGDTWVCLLPNGYTIEMIDVTDRGFLYSRERKTSTRDLLSKKFAPCNWCRDICWDRSTVQPTTPGILNIAMWFLLISY
jgi:hypothetical protein